MSYFIRLLIYSPYSLITPASYSLLSFSMLSLFSRSIFSSFKSLLCRDSISFLKSFYLLSISFLFSLIILISILSFVIFGSHVWKWDFPLIVETALDDLKILKFSGLTVIAKLLHRCNSFLLSSLFCLINFWK